MENYNNYSFRLQLISFRENSNVFLLFSGILSFVCMIAFSFYVRPGLDQSVQKYQLIDLQLTFEKTKGLAILNSWGHSGREHFLGTIWIDFIYPMAYSVSDGLFFIHSVVASIKWSIAGLVVSLLVFYIIYY